MSCTTEVAHGVCMFIIGRGNIYNYSIVMITTRSVKVPTQPRAADQQQLYNMLHHHLQAARGGIFFYIKVKVNLAFNKS
eukprot:m.229192 g.229192  ORF g.229192 m.229192 type:complete len:79 (+) comp15204_c1_seq12:1875-2111(+)